MPLVERRKLSGLTPTPLSATPWQELYWLKKRATGSAGCSSRNPNRSSASTLGNKYRRIQFP